MDDELLQTFRFQVSLTLSASKGPDVEPVDPARAATDDQRLADIGFQECSGLELEADIREYLEGGRNDGVVRRVGRVKLQPLVLKRGMVVTRPQARQPGQPQQRGQAGQGQAPATVRPELWAWLQDTVVGRLPIRRYDGLVEVKGPTKGSPVLARWRFIRGLPLKVSGPTLNAKTGEVAIEELHIAHEGLHLVTKVDK
ncbi:MAG TPA: phage tail protein [Actinomycetes bacterium]|nr:phage tail protein [Actinomycetes bacterium]